MKIKLYAELKLTTDLPIIYIRTYTMKKQVNRNSFHPRTVLILAAAAVAFSHHMAFAFSAHHMKTAKAPRICCLHLSRDEYLRPHFETSTSAVAEMNYQFDFDRIVECAEVGECPVEEMTQMLKGTVGEKRVCT